jgi:hypothetical protein
LLLSSAAQAGDLVLIGKTLTPTRKIPVCLVSLA